MSPFLYAFCPVSFSLFEPLRLSPLSPENPVLVPHSSFFCRSRLCFLCSLQGSIPTVCSSLSVWFLFCRDSIASDHHSIPFSLRISFHSFLVVSVLVLRLLGPVVLRSQAGVCHLLCLVQLLCLILCQPSFPLPVSHLFCWSWPLSLPQISGLRILCQVFWTEKCGRSDL